MFCGLSTGGWSSPTRSSDADLPGARAALPMRDAVLVTGGSGIALGLPAELPRAGLLAPARRQRLPGGRSARLDRRCPAALLGGHL